MTTLAYTASLMLFLLSPASVEESFCAGCAEIGPTVANDLSATITLRKNTTGGLVDYCKVTASMVIGDYQGETACEAVSSNCGSTVCSMAFSVDVSYEDLLAGPDGCTTSPGTISFDENTASPAVWSDYDKETHTIGGATQTLIPMAPDPNPKMNANCGGREVLKQIKLKGGGTGGGGGFGWVPEEDIMTFRFACAICSNDN